MDQLVGLLGGGISTVLNTQDNTNRRNADRHPCLEWNSNP
jgi:hypothetical protein